MSGSPAIVMFDGITIFGYNVVVCWTCHCQDHRVPQFTPTIEELRTTLRESYRSAVLPSAGLRWAHTHAVVLALHHEYTSTTVPPARKPYADPPNS